MKNNTCNRDLQNGVETGAFQFFECPPMLFSPNNSQGKAQEGRSISNSDSRESLNKAVQ